MSERLTLQDLIDLLAQKRDITKKDSELFLRELVTLISETIEENEPVRIKDFGTFKLIKVNARKSVNVNTGEEIEIAAHYKLSFTPDKSLRDSINKPFAHFESVVIGDGIDFESTMEEIVEPKIKPEKEEVREQKQAFVEDIKDTSKQISEIEVYPTVINVDDKLHNKKEIENNLNVEPNKIEMEEEKKNFEEYEIDDELDNNNEDLPEYEESSNKKTYIIIAVILLIVLGLIFWNKCSTKEVTPQVVPETAVVTDTIPAEIEEEDEPAIENVSDVPSIGVEKISEGQTLRLISLKYYGRKIFWVYIYQENADKLNDPNIIHPGVKLTIPSLKKYGVNANNSADIQTAVKMENELVAKYGYIK